MKIHFIGIGGIGVSALARYYLKKGNFVSGSDLVESEITKDLEKLGAKIFIGEHKAKNLSKDTNLVIYSLAVPKDNPEIKKAKELREKNKGLKILSYPQALGELTKKRFTIAICGTHGKSTTSAMIGLILTKAKLDPTVIIGTKLKEFVPKNGGGSNCRIGKSKFLVIEADEHFASFLNYWPKIIVLTTLEPDHLDFYKNFKNYILAFKKFVFHLPKDGILVANKDDKNIFRNFSKFKRKIIWYSLKEKDSQKLRKILKIPGEFNISNALGALKVAQILKIPKRIVFLTLSQYKGAWRRFQIKKAKIDKKKFTLIHDYAHHPTEIRETLKAAREKYKSKKIWCIFQPHQYQRTFYLFSEFVKVLKELPIDKLVITDIYDVSGREDPKIKKLVSAPKLVKAIKKENVFYLRKEKILEFLEKNLKDKEIVFFMGAGDIYNLALKLC